MSIAPLTVSVLDAARALGVGRTTTFKLIAAGRLRVHRIGRRTLVTVESLRALVEA